MQLTGYRKDLIQMAMNDKFELLPVMHQMSRYADCDKFLKWLIENRITGLVLSDWLKNYHKNSVMGMVKFIIKSHNKDRQEQAILLNRDWS